MAKPLSEHSSTLGAKPARKESRLQPVHGGHVRRVEFESNDGPVFHEAEAEPRPAPSRAPARDDDMDHIHWEIDNLERIKRGAPPRERRTQRYESKRVFETERGAVEAAERAEGRVLYTRRRVGGREEEQRFHSGLVDRIIAEKYKGGPRFEEVEAPKKGFLARRKKTFEPVEEPSEYQPQCEAVTRDGMQCRNSAKDGSEYCGSHQGYTPRSIDDVLEAPKAGDQCAAYTRDGDQCKRAPRSGSKYCSTHKGYRPPTRAQLEKRMDTEPRVKGAPDTAPKFR